MIFEREIWFSIQTMTLLEIFYVFKATPILLLVLRAPEAGNEPFWNKTKLKNVGFLNLW